MISRSQILFNSFNSNLYFITEVIDFKRSLAMVTTQAFPFRCETQAFLLLKANSLEPEALWQTFLLLLFCSELFISLRLIKKKKNQMEKNLLQFGNNRRLLVFVGKKKTEYCLTKMCSIAEIIILNRLLWSHFEGGSHIYFAILTFTFQHLPSIYPYIKSLIFYLLISLVIFWKRKSPELKY